MLRLSLAFFLALLATEAATAFSEDGCEQQRNQYPANWSDTSQERPLFLCRSHYGGSFQIKIGTTDENGRTLMSLAPVVEPGGDSQPVLRIWLDGEQMRRLREGKYFGTVLRSENGCWIRGNLEDSGLLLMDNANAPADDPEQAGSFYNKAPRFTVFGDNAYDCEPIK